MKFIREELSANHFPRYLYAFSKEEARIMYGAIVNALRWTPKTFATEQTISRIRDMEKKMRLSIPLMDEDK